MWLKDTMHGDISASFRVPILLFFSLLPIPAVLQVIGIELKPNAPPYTVYDKVERFDNGRLRLNMLTYSGVSGLITCS